MPIARLIWRLAGLAAIGTGIALAAMGWVGSPELEVFEALGYSIAAIGISILVATKVT